MCCTLYLFRLSFRTLIWCLDNCIFIQWLINFIIYFLFFLSVCVELRSCDFRMIKMFLARLSSTLPANLEFCLTAERRSLLPGLHSAALACVATTQHPPSPSNLSEVRHRWTWETLVKFLTFFKTLKCPLCYLIAFRGIEWHILEYSGSDHSLLAAGGLHWSRILQVGGLQLVRP